MYGLYGCMVLQQMSSTYNNVNCTELAKYQPVCDNFSKYTYPLSLSKKRSIFIAGFLCITARYLHRKMLSANSLHGSSIVLFTVKNNNGLFVHRCNDLSIFLQAHCNECFSP